MYLQSALLLAVLPENINSHNYFENWGLYIQSKMLIHVIIFWSKKMILDKINRILVHVFATKIDMGYWYNRLKYLDIYSVCLI